MRSQNSVFHYRFSPSQEWDASSLARSAAPRLVVLIKMQKLCRIIAYFCLSFLFLLFSSSAHAQYNAAQYLGQDVPTTWTAGQTKTIHILMQNMGTKTWMPGTHFLGSQSPENNYTWGSARVSLSAPVPPGQQASFTLTATAPSSPGIYAFQWRMVEESVEWFGDYTPAVSVNVTAPPPVNSAQFVSQSVPTSWTIGQTQTVSVTMKNTGNTTWTAGSKYSLGSQNPQDGTWWGTGRVAVSGSVAPGQTTTFTFAAKAPSSANTYNFQWRMVQDGVEWFGDYTPNLALTVSPKINSAQFISQSVPANWTLGQSQTVSVTMKNTGNTTWGSTYFLGSQNPQDNTIWNSGRVSAGTPVAPGQTATFTFKATAPSSSGTYNFQWRMLEDQVEWFGDYSTNVPVYVSGGSSSTLAATLQASPVNVRASSGVASITFTGSATDSAGKATKADLYVDGGSGFQNMGTISGVSTGSTSVAFSKTVALAPGAYKAKLRATDVNGATADSSSIVVNVASEAMLGTVNGVVIDANNAPQLNGWACTVGNNETLSYSVFINAPSVQTGGTQVGSGVANISTDPANASVQASCQTPGVGHHFNINLNALSASVTGGIPSGTPLYVRVQNGAGQSTALSCAANNCNMPSSLRITLTTPADGDIYQGPASVFMRAKLTNGTAPYDEIAFSFDGGAWVTAQADTSAADTYYVTQNSVSARSAPYLVSARVRKGNITVYSTVNTIYVAGQVTSRTLTLANPANGATVAQGTLVALTATPDTTSGVAKVRFYVDGAAAGNGVLSGNSWTYNWPAGASGSHTVRAYSYDANGNLLAQTTNNSFTVQSSTSSSAPITVVVDVPHATNPIAGSLPGVLNVNSSGAATYNIQLSVPPGTAGMAPELSLNYSSNSPNGMVGMGWALGGLSTIHRCPKTIATDGVAGRISFDNADRLCLDGQRLVRANGTNPGTDPTAQDNAYWATDAEYRTEIESFARVTRSGSGFKVEQKDGRIVFYGNDAASTIPAQGRSDGQALLWPVGRVQDRSGNYMTYQYTVDSATGEYLPSKILYGGNSTVGTTPDLAVTFAYETRTDSNVQYMGGSRNDLRNRLTHVRTYTGTAADGSSGTLVQDYTVHYVQSATTGRSLVDWVQACGTNPVTSVQECLPKTVFDWAVGAAPTLTTLPVADSLPVPTEPTIRSNPNGAWLSTPAQFQGNLDGSGVTTLFSNRRYACSNGDNCLVDADNILRLRVPGQADFDRKLNLSGTSIATNATLQIRVADLDGDGRDDLVLIPFGATTTTPWAYCLTVINGTDGKIDFSCKNGGTGYPEAVIDIKNDRKAKVLMPFDNSNTATICGLNNGVMSCSTLPMVQQDPLLGATGFYNKAEFSMSGIELSKQGMSDIGMAWKQYVTAADPAHSCVPPTSGTNISPGCNKQDVHLGVAACFNTQAGLVCKSVMQKNYPGEGEESYLTKLDVISNQSVGDLNGDGLTDFIYTLKNVDGSQTLRSVLCLSKENGVDCTSVTPQLQETYVLQSEYQSYPGPVVSMYAKTFTNAGVVGDLVGDGMPRFLTLGGSAKVCRLNGTALVCDPANGTDGLTGPAVPVTVDASGVPAFLILHPISSTDPMAQPYYASRANIGTYVGKKFPYSAYTFRGATATDRIIRVTNGLGHKSEADYARGDDTTVYSTFATSNGVQQRPAYPQMLTNPGVLVKQLRVDNGKQGWLRKNFYYEGAMADASGRGTLGFTTMRVTDVQSGVATTSTMSQTWPYVGMALKNRAVSPQGIVLSDSTSTPSQIKLTQVNGAVTVFPFASNEATARKDWNGADLGSNSITNEFTLDTTPIGWSQVRQTATVSGNGKVFTTVTQTAFKNDGTNWLVGLPTSTTVTKSATGQADIVRTTNYVHDSATGLRTQETVQPGTTTLQVITDYLRTRNRFGLVNTKKQTWRDPYTNTDMSRNVSDVDYDDKGRFVKIERNALGHSVIRSFYAGTGAPSSAQDPNSLVTQWNVDFIGRVTLEKHADGTETRQSYKQCQGDCPAYATSIVVKEYFSGGSRIAVPEVMYSNSARQLVQQLTWGFDGSQIVKAQRYDDRGRLYEIDQPRFTSGTAYIEKRTLYDDLNRVTDVSSYDENGIERITHTDYNGFVVTDKNARLQQRVTTNNVLGQPEQVKDAINGITKFEYEAFGNLSKTTDPNGNVIVVSYDTLGRKTSLNDPDLGLINYYVDPVGRTWKQINPVQRDKGTFSRMEFDALDRMTGRYEPDLESHWVFDTAAKGIGQLAEAYTGTPSVKDYRRIHTYDLYARPDETTFALKDGSYWSKMSYDAWGRVVEQQFRRGTSALKQFSQRYNNMGYLERVERGALVLWKAQSQDASQRIRQALLGNGLTELRGYSAYSARLQSSTLRAADQSLRVDEGYQYDALGNVKTRTQYWNGVGFSESFDYDDLNRVHYTYLNSTTQTFEYDAAGNILSKTGAGTYTYPGVDNPTYRTVSVHAHGASTIGGGSFSYDYNGNVLSGAGRKITWKTFDMPETISNTAGTISSTFTYGPEHQRTYQSKSGGSSVIYAGVQEVETSGGTVKVKTYWPNGIGLEIDTITSSATTTDLMYVHKDRLGSPVLITNQNGAAVEQLAYDTWGKRRLPDSSGTPNSLDGVIDNRGFTGHEMLDQFDLVHMNGRVYDPLTGRFLSGDALVGDPVNGQNYNRYSYVLNNPTNLTDPTGFDAATAMPTVEIHGCAEVCREARKTATNLQNQAARALEIARQQFSSSARTFVRASSATVVRSVALASPTVVVTVASAVIPGNFLENRRPGEMPPSWLKAAETNAKAALMKDGADGADAKGKGTNSEGAKDGKKDTLQPGPHAGESIPARGPGRDFSKEERDKINEIGQNTGCHTCGSKDPGTTSGNHIPDHQPPNALNPSGGPQELYPHCLTCSRVQGGQVRGTQSR